MYFVIKRIDSIIELNFLLGITQIFFLYNTFSYSTYHARISIYIKLNSARVKSVTKAK